MVNSKFNGKIFGSSIIFVFVLGIISFAQDTPKTTVVFKKDNRPVPVARRNNVNCAGYIQTAPINTNFEIVGADDEREQYNYSNGEFLYVSQGANSGVKVGNTYSVVRPRGQFKTKLSDKKGNLGFYVEEVGSIEIVKVRDNISVARVKNACESFLLGDLLQPLENREVPLSKTRPALDLFAEPNGKTVGKIVMGRDAREVFSRDEIVYIDLGSEDSVKVGEYLTVFRPLGKGGILNIQEDETVSSRDVDYGGETFKGNPYSILASRNAGETAQGGMVKTSQPKKRRPTGLRKIVGDMIILNVKEKTATALILRNAQEIHLGDYVEIQ